MEAVGGFMVLNQPGSAFPNWFVQGGANAYFGRNLQMFAGRSIHALQIGAYTGDATEWLLDNILTNGDATLTDVDPWSGSGEVEHATIDWLEVERLYDERHAETLASGQLIKMRMTSAAFFAAAAGQMYDFIYIDGDHTSEAVLRDGVHALELLAPGGIIAFDDVEWRSPLGTVFEPKPAIEAIRLCYSPSLEVIDVGLQLWMRRKA